MCRAFIHGVTSRSNVKMVSDSPKSEYIISENFPNLVECLVNFIVRNAT